MTGAIPREGANGTFTPTPYAPKPGAKPPVRFPWSPIPEGPKPPPPAGDGGWWREVEPTQVRASRMKGKPRTEQIAGDGAVIPVIYGRTIVPGLIDVVRANGREITILAVWCEGEVNSFEKVYYDHIEKARHGGASYEADYAGTDAQGVDTELATLIGATYVDTLPNTAYSVLSFNSSNGFPRVSADIKGRKVYDPRDVGQDVDDDATWLWSDNPALCLADFISNRRFGLGREMDWATVEVAADFCDELVGDAAEKRRTINLAIEQRYEPSQIIDILRAYAKCLVVDDNGTMKLYPITTSTSEISVGESDVVAGSLSWKQRGIQNTPNIIEVEYRDTSEVPYKMARATVFGDGVEEGLRLRRESRVSMPGVNRYSQAYREAVERLNQATIVNLFITFRMFDLGIKMLPGTVFALTHSAGFTAKLFRVVSVSDGGNAIFTINAEEYDDELQSDVVVSAPSVGNTSLPNPLTPPPPTGLVVTERVSQVQAYSGFESRIKAVWNEADYSLTRGYRITVMQGDDLIDELTVTGIEYVSPPIPEGLEYKVAISTWSGITFSDPAEEEIIILGKYAIPNDVPYLDGYEVGGELHLQWGDPDDGDIRYYEIRYWPVGDTWEDGEVLDRCDARMFYNKGDVPPGTWVFGVKAIDSVEQYSVNAATKQIEVTSDIDSFLSDIAAFTNPSTINMTAYYVHGERVWTTNFGDGMGFGYSNTDNATGTLDGTMADTGNPATARILADPHTAGTSEWLSESYDFGVSMGGTWAANVDVTNDAGVYQPYIEVSTDGSSWSSLNGLSVVATGRFVRLRLQTEGVMTVRGVPTIRVNAIARRESFQITTNAGAPYTITLARRYAKIKAILVTPNGSTARYGVVDNAQEFGAWYPQYVVGGYVADDYVIDDGEAPFSAFDVYAFSSAGAQVAAPVYVQFEGV